ncbi:MAG: hypothetical protein WC595_06760 [Candidatus Nanoarchaeia archaeon]
MKRTSLATLVTSAFLAACQLNPIESSNPHCEYELIYLQNGDTCVKNNRSRLKYCDKDGDNKIDTISKLDADFSHCQEYTRENLVCGISSVTEAQRYFNHGLETATDECTIEENEGY